MPECIRRFRFPWSECVFNVVHILRTGWKWRIVDETLRVIIEGIHQSRETRLWLAIEIKPSRSLLQPQPIRHFCIRRVRFLSLASLMFELNSISHDSASLSAKSRDMHCSAHTPSSPFSLLEQAVQVTTSEIKLIHLSVLRQKREWTPCEQRLASSTLQHGILLLSITIPLNIGSPTREIQPMMSWWSMSKNS